MLQGLLAASFGGWLGAAEAQVVVRVAPPPPRDEQAPGNRVRGNWRRGDRDGDGVRNRDDRAPNNPNRN